MAETQLSPIERVVTRLDDEGVSTPEIAARIGKKPGTVQRILAMSRLRNGESDRSSQDDPLRPIERVVLRLRSEGQGYGEIGNRLGRSGRHIQHIERYAELKLGA